LRFDSSRVVKAWFIGLNPQLDDESPAEAIREGRLKEAMNAARAFVAGVKGAALRRSPGRGKGLSGVAGLRRLRAAGLVLSPGRRDLR
jgi:hypothetical protein